MIIQKRRDLFLILIQYAAEDIKPDDPRYQQLVRQYGALVINILLETYQKSLQEKSTMLDEPYGYHEYCQAFTRFGGMLPFLSCAEPAAHSQPSSRKKELYDLILTESDYWQNITPPAIPLRPAKLSHSTENLQNRDPKTAGFGPIREL